MELRRRKYTHNWELDHKKKPNKKKKISVVGRKSSSVTENDSNSDYLNNLPVDVLTSVFLRCPLKSLSMLRCTSKSWNEFIISPSFQHSHLRQSTENRYPQLLVVEQEYMSRTNKRRLQFVSVDMDGSKEELYTVTVSDGHQSFSGMSVSYGLVCLKSDRRICLCNPAMQQFCELPEFSPSVTPGYDHFGFGYLHSRKEYKLVHFIYTGMGPSRYSNWCLLRDLQYAQLKCEVLTINNKIGGGISSSGWKQIADTPLYHPYLPGLLVNECMYWSTTHYHLPSYPREILSFDFEDEKFVTIYPPPSFGYIQGLACGLSLMDLKGMLCLPDAKRFIRSSILDLWILKDRISSTWVKQYSINLVKFGAQNIKSCFRTWNDKIVFTHLDKVVIYDLKRKCLRRVKRSGFQRYEIYSKSLFSLPVLQESVKRKKATRRRRML